MTDQTTPQWTIDTERLDLLLKGEITLDRNSHTNFEEGHCAMEVVSWLADLDFTDAPECASRYLGDVIIGINDNFNDTDRRRLVPVLPSVVGTKSDGLDDERQAVLRDQATRVYIPTMLEYFGHPDAARQLRELPEITVANRYADTVPAELIITGLSEDLDREWARLPFWTGPLLKRDEEFDISIAATLANRLWNSTAASTILGVVANSYSLTTSLAKMHLYKTARDIKMPPYSGNHDEVIEELYRTHFGEINDKLVDATYAALVAMVKPGVEAPTPLPFEVTE